MLSKIKRVMFYFADSPFFDCRSLKLEKPLGGLLAVDDGEGLCGLWLDGAKHYAKTLGGDFAEKRTRTLDETKKWLDIYFGGRKPDFIPKLHMRGSAFRLEVWKILLEIPYSQTATYGEIASKISARRGGKMSVARSGTTKFP